MVGIHVGETIVFSPTGVEVRVADDRKVEYEGRLYSLSAFTGTFLPPERQNASGAYAGPTFFTYNGETLSDLRNNKEEGQ